MSAKGGTCFQASKSAVKMKCGRQMYEGLLERCLRRTLVADRMKNRRDAVVNRETFAQ